MKLLREKRKLHVKKKTKKTSNTSKTDEPQLIINNLPISLRYGDKILKNEEVLFE